MFEEAVEKKIENTEKKITVFKMRLDRYEKAFKELHEEVNIAPSELTDFLNTSTNFDSETWASLQNYRDELDNKLAKELENIRNPLKTAETYAQRSQIKPHWMFVR